MPNGGIGVCVVDYKDKNDILLPTKSKKTPCTETAQETDSGFGG